MQPIAMAGGREKTFAQRSRCCQVGVVADVCSHLLARLWHRMVGRVYGRLCTLEKYSNRETFRIRTL